MSVRAGGLPALNYQGPSPPLGNGALQPFLNNLKKGPSLRHALSWPAQYYQGWLVTFTSAPQRPGGGNHRRHRGGGPRGEEGAAGGQREGRRAARRKAGDLRQGPAGEPLPELEAAPKEGHGHLQGQGGGEGGPGPEAGQEGPEPWELGRQGVAAELEAMRVDGPAALHRPGQGRSRKLNNFQGRGGGGDLGEGLSYRRPGGHTRPRQRQ